jgi:hypothetical protein
MNQIKEQMQRKDHLPKEWVLTIKKHLVPHAILSYYKGFLNIFRSRAKDVNYKKPKSNGRMKSVAEAKKAAEETTNQELNEKN